VAGLGISTMLVKHFASKPSDPNLAEIGISSNLEELAAPAEPEASGNPNSVPESLAGSFKGTRIRNLEMGEGSAVSSPLIDSELKPASFIDPQAAHLDNSAYQWMPLCRDTDGAVSRGRHALESTNDLMPRCDDQARPTTTPSGNIRPN
jgi:hypothetical protein